MDCDLDETKATRNMKVSQEELEAYNWLCALEIHSEAEAIDKEMCLCMLDEYKFKDYFQRKETEKKWKI